MGVEGLKHELEQVLSEHGLALTNDGRHVRWAKDNQRHPRNWSSLRKAYDFSIIFWLEVFTCVFIL